MGFLQPPTHASLASKGNGYPGDLVHATVQPDHPLPLSQCHSTNGRASLIAVPFKLLPAPSTSLPPQSLVSSAPPLKPRPRAAQPFEPSPCPSLHSSSSSLNKSETSVPRLGKRSRQDDEITSQQDPSLNCDIHGPLKKARLGPAPTSPSQFTLANSVTSTSLKTWSEMPLALAVSETDTSLEATSSDMPRALTDFEEPHISLGTACSDMSLALTDFEDSQISLGAARSDMSLALTDFEDSYMALETISSDTSLALTDSEDSNMSLQTKHSDIDRSSSHMAVRREAAGAESSASDSRVPSTNRCYESRFSPGQKLRSSRSHVLQDRTTAARDEGEPLVHLASGDPSSHKASQYFPCRDLCSGTRFQSISCLNEHSSSGHDRSSSSKENQSIALWFPEAAGHRTATQPSSRRGYASYRDRLLPSSSENSLPRCLR